MTNNTILIILINILKLILKKIMFNYFVFLHLITQNIVLMLFTENMPNVIYQYTRI